MNRTVNTQWCVVPGKGRHRSSGTSLTPFGAVPASWVCTPCGRCLARAGDELLRCASTYTHLFGGTVWHQVRRAPGGMDHGLRRFSSAAAAGAELAGADRWLWRLRGELCPARGSLPGAGAAPALVGCCHARAPLTPSRVPATQPLCALGRPAEHSRSFAPISSLGSRLDPIHTVAPIRCVFLCPPPKRRPARAKRSAGHSGSGVVGGARRPTASAQFYANSIAHRSPHPTRIPPERTAPQLRPNPGTRCGAALRAATPTQTCIIRCGRKRFGLPVQHRTCGSVGQISWTRSCPPYAMHEAEDLGADQRGSRSSPSHSARRAMICDRCPPILHEQRTTTNDHVRTPDEHIGGRSLLAAPSSPRSRTPVQVCA
jgi:hypothetical protein